MLDRYLAGNRLRRCAAELRGRRQALSPGDLVPYLYTIVCSWIGHDLLARFAGGRRWDVCLQFHMRAVEIAPALATRLGRYLTQMVPSCLVKVPFMPQAPHCLLIARDLERGGLPVNFTSTFSARQAVAAAAAALLEQALRPYEMVLILLAQLRRARGFTNTRAFRDGVEAWKQAGLPPMAAAA